MMADGWWWGAETKQSNLNNFAYFVCVSVVVQLNTMEKHILRRQFVMCNASFAQFAIRSSRIVFLFSSFVKILSFDAAFARNDNDSCVCTVRHFVFPINLMEF